MKLINGIIMIKSFFVIMTLLVNTALMATEYTLFIGDSHSVTTFGRTLDKNLRSLPEIDVQTIASCGAVARYFWVGTNTRCGFFFRDSEGQISRGTRGPTPLLRNIFSSRVPEHTIVQLSGNYAGYTDDFILKDIEKTAKFITVHGSKCLWVGPADSRDRSRIPRLKKLIEKAASPYCDLFWSDQVTKYPEVGGDGIHYSGKEGIRQAKIWANAVFDYFLETK